MNRWYAVTVNGDYECGYGSRSFAEAMRLAEQEIENGAKVEIAAVDEYGSHSHCAYILRKDLNGEWVRGKKRKREKMTKWREGNGGSKK